MDLNLNLCYIAVLSISCHCFEVYCYWITLISNTHYRYKCNYLHISMGGITF